MNEIGHVFLVGCPRSGTTLVQSMLAANSAVHTLPETHFFSRIIPDAKWAKILGLTDKKVRVFLKSKLIDITDGGVKGPSGLTSLFVSSYGAEFARFLDFQANGQGKKTWIEKTPQHLHRIPQIKKSIPDTKFVHILRAGKDTIASLYHVTQKYPERWGGALSVEDCIRRWVQDITVSRSRINDSQSHFVIYEDLLADPESTLHKLCKFTNVSYQPQMLSESSAAYHESVAEKDAEWTANAGQPLDRNHQGDKFHSYLNENQQVQVKKAIASAGLADLTESFPKFTN